MKATHTSPEIQDTSVVWKAGEPKGTTNWETRLRRRNKGYPAVQCKVKASKHHFFVWSCLWFSVENGNLFLGQRFGGPLICTWRMHYASWARTMACFSSITGRNRWVWCLYVKSEGNEKEDESVGSRLYSLSAKANRILTWAIIGLCIQKNEMSHVVTRHQFSTDLSRNIVSQDTCQNRRLDTFCDLRLNFWRLPLLLWKAWSFPFPRFLSESTEQRNNRGIWGSTTEALSFPRIVKPGFNLF
jgi:hypothetical protein